MTGRVHLVNSSREARVRTGRQDRQVETSRGGNVDLATETRALLRRWHDQEDHQAREELVARMLPLARSLARRYANKGEPLDDLASISTAR